MFSPGRYTLIFWKSRKSTASGAVDQTPAKKSGYVTCSHRLDQPPEEWPVTDPSARFADRAKLRLDGGDQFLDQCLAARAVVGGVGENVMAVMAVGVEHDVNDLDSVELWCD